MPNSAAYEAGLKKANAASAAYREIQKRYRAKEIDDKEYIAGRKAFEQSEREFDQLRGESPRSDSSTDPKKAKNDEGADIEEEDEPDPFEAAVVKYREAAKAFRNVQKRFRSGEISRTEFDAERKLFEAAQAKLDEVNERSAEVEKEDKDEAWNEGESRDDSSAIAALDPVKLADAATRIDSIATRVLSGKSYQTEFRPDAESKWPKIPQEFHHLSDGLLGYWSKLSKANREDAFGAWRKQAQLNEARSRAQDKLRT